MLTKQSLGYTAPPVGQFIYYSKLLILFSIDEEKTEIENLNPENTEVAVKSKAEEEAESFFSSIQTGLASLGAQIPSWKQLSKSAQNGITTVTKSAQNGIATVIFA